MIYAKPATSLLVVFRAYLASDHVTAATGKTIAITISKNGGAFGNPNAGATNATEISSGFYKVTLDTTDTGTAGPLAVRGAVATIDDVGAIFYVGQSPADATHLLGTAWLTPAVAGTPDVNAKLHGGTSQTGRDIGASVLLSSGTGTGQLDFTSGVVKSNLVQILATALTETAGLIAAGFKKFFNVASPTLTCVGVDQTGDSYARVGAPAGASVSADIAAGKVDTAAIKLKTDNLPAAPAAVGDIPTANVNADALLDRTAGVETNRTVRKALRLILSAAAGILSGAATSTVKVRDTNDSKDRITATVDSDGNRSAVTLDDS